jgi:hypothetical protein
MSARQRRRQGPAKSPFRVEPIGTMGAHLERLAVVVIFEDLTDFAGFERAA